MKKHWKKILLSIFGIYLVYGIITLVPAYLENKEWEQREQTAIESINIMDDPNLSQYEKNKKLRDLHGIPDDGVVVKGNLRYELQDNSNNSFDKSSKAYKERNEVCKEIYFKVKDISDKYDFHTIFDTYKTSGSFYFRSDKEGAADDNYYYSTLTYDPSDEFLILKFSIASFSMGEEFSSKDYEVLQDIIDVLDISDFSIDIDKSFDFKPIRINLDNGWFLDYRYSETYFRYSETYRSLISLEFKKQL